MSTPYPRPLRYPATCRVCGRDLPPGTRAWWDASTRDATCVGCNIRNPADPFEGVDPALKGTPGGSAQAEHHRRADRPDAGTWLKGAQGERHLSAVLHKETRGGQLIVLDDRRVGTRANIDHVAIAPSGVYVIDAKNYSGRVEQEVGSGESSTGRLIVKGWDHTELVTKMRWQTDTVRAALDGTDVPVIPVLCFVAGSNWGLFDPAFTIGDVHIVWPRALRKLLRRAGPLNGAIRTECARLISIQLPPASPQSERKVG